MAVATTATINGKLKKSARKTVVDAENRKKGGIVSNDRSAATTSAGSMEKELTHFANAKTVTAEEELPIMDDEGITVEAKPWFSKEAELIFHSIDHRLKCAKKRKYDSKYMFNKM